MNANGHPASHGYKMQGISPSSEHVPFDVTISYPRVPGRPLRRQELHHAAKSDRSNALSEVRRINNAASRMLGEVSAETRALQCAASTRK